jgi:hypothetical protein
LIAEQHRRAPAANGHRFYVEALEHVLPRIHKLIADKSGKLGHTIIGKGWATAPEKRP